MKLYRRIFGEDLWLAIACILFLAFLLPHLFTIPYLDGNIDLVKAYDYYSGSFTQLADHWGSLHPPLKVFMASSLFRLFGIHTWTYSIIGIFIGVAGIIAMYVFAWVLFGRRVAGVAGLLLATSPLFISVGIFSLIDYLLTVWVLLVLLSYITRRYVWCGFFLVLSVLTKETALLLPMSLLFVELSVLIVQKSITRRNIIFFFPVFISLITFEGWSLYLHSIGQRPWSDWIFTETANQGATFTILHNLITGTFMNEYAIENWLHLFVLNYMWIYTAFALSAAVWLVVRIGKRKQRQMVQIFGDQKIRALFVYFLFGFFYTISVLSLQTYTIPRYVLPVIPLILLLAAWSMATITHHWRLMRIPLVFLFLGIGYLALYTSTDPVSRVLWGDTRWMGERLYNLRDHLSGNDGITYNLQYLRIVGQRSRLISQAQKEGNSIISRDCYFLFPDPNNEKKMFQILSLERIPKNRWCIAPEAN